jgi:4-amino-4-deoxy-L-arabinose transferase-like glycosyltransferase
MERGVLQQKLQRIIRSVGFIVVVAFAVRVAYLYFYFVSTAQQTTADNSPFGYEAGAVAAAIAQGRGFSSPLKLVQTGPTAWFAPVFPYLLACVFKLFGVYSYASSLVIRFADNAFSACTCWPIYAIATRAFGKRCGASAAWIWVFFPLSLFFSTVWVWDTALSALMLSLIVAVTLELRGSGRLSYWMGYGGLCAAGAMVNPALISTLPALALWAIWPLRRQFLPSGRLLAASALIFVAGVMPWTIRNYVVLHKLIPFRSNFGLELWLGNNPLVPELWSPILHPNNDAQEATKYARLTEIPYMEEKEHQAFQFIRTHPADSLRFTLHRLSDNWIGTWDSPSDIWDQGSLQARINFLGNCLFPFLTLLGALFAYRRRNEAVIPLAAVMIFFPLIFYITHTEFRYRHPMDPIMLVLATYGFAYPLSQLLKHLSGLQARIPASHTTD